MDDAAQNISPDSALVKEAAPRLSSPAIRAFLDYLSLEKHFSDHTLKSYGADLLQFVAFLMGDACTAESFREAQIDARLLACDAVAIRAYLAHMYGLSYSKSTTARKLSTLRSFFKFQVRRGTIALNPLSTVRTPKQEKRLPKCADAEQITRPAQRP